MTRLRTSLAPGKEGSIACVRGGVVERVIRATREFAATLGYDVVGEAVPMSDGSWLVDGAPYPDGTEPADEVAQRQALQQAAAAIQAYADLATPTGAQTVQQVRLLGRIVLNLMRWRAGQSDT